MTKLSGTSGQAFSGLAESLNVRGTSRSSKSTGAKSAGDSSFNDLLRNVSNLAKRALNDEGSDTATKAGTLRTRLVPSTEQDKVKDAAAHDDTVAAEESKSTEKSTEKKSTHKSSDETAEKSAEPQTPVDHAAKPEVQDRPSIAATIGQELAAAPVVTSQVQAPISDRKDASARDERPSATKREIQSTSTAKVTTADPAPPTSAAAGLRGQATTSQAGAAAPASQQQGSEASSKAMPAAPGFEAVTANLERAVKTSAREVLPEATKVTVVQQETHMPPVQFSAPQQVANAVVTELKESSAPAAAAAAPHLASTQSSAPEPLKILTINLEPPALGNVTVRLRLVGSEVSVQLAAERKDTSQMLDQQRDSIRDLMQSAGYVADVAPVQHGSLDGFQSGSGQSQSQLSGQQQPSSQSQGSFNGASTSSGQSDGGAKQAREERQSNQETRHDQDVAPQLRRGPVYL